MRRYGELGSSRGQPAATPLSASVAAETTENATGTWRAIRSVRFLIAPLLFALLWTFVLPQVAKAEDWAEWTAGTNTSATFAFANGTTGTINLTPALCNDGNTMIGAPESAAHGSATNYPSTWYTPTPPDPAEFIKLDMNGDGTISGCDSNPVVGTLTINFSSPVSSPKFHFYNLDAAEYRFLDGVTVNRLSGNNEFEVTGANVNTTPAIAEELGCEANDGTNPEGACGSISVIGTFTALTIDITDFDPGPGGDGHLFTMSLAELPAQLCSESEQRATERYWFFGNGGAIDFDTSGTTATAFSGTQNTSEGSTVVTDISGQLLFWSNGQIVFDRDSNPMPNGTGLNGNPSATQTVAAFPSLSQPGIYFVVTTDTDVGNGANGNLTYSIVNMSLNEGLGEVTIKNQLLGSPNTASEALTAVPNADGTGYWVLTYTNNSPNLLAYEFDGNGPTGTVTTSILPSNNGDWYGSLYFSKDLSQLVALSSFGNAATDPTIVRLLRFDAASGQAIEELSWNLPTGADTGNSGYTADFSPDGDYVYATKIFSGGHLYRYHIAGATTGTEVKATEEDLGSIGTTGGHVRRAPDGRMYVARRSEGTLGVVNTPDAPDAGYVPEEFSLPTGVTSQFGLPQMVTGCPPVFDLGDAPNSYGTQLPDGAIHTVQGYDSNTNTAPLMLGSLIDVENSGQPNDGANDDDNNGVDDEDGVIPAGFSPGQSFNLPVNVTGDSGILNAWIDWNADGDFDDPGEQIATDIAVNDGSNNLSGTVPADAVLGTTYARFRLSTQSGLGPTGPAPDGEVEDYQFAIGDPLFFGCSNLVTFDASSENWRNISTNGGFTIVNDYGIAAWDADEGNPGGAIKDTDRDGSWQELLTPDLLSNGYTTDYRFAIGSILQFDYKNDTGLDYDVYVAIQGRNGQRYFYNFRPQIADSTLWTQVQVPMDPNQWVKDFNNGSGPTGTNSPTAAEFEAVLENVDHFAFSIEGKEGDDTTLFDNFGQACDFGDAPVTYGSPSHSLMTDSLWLGAVAPDGESTSQPNANADGDDINGVDDEDGVTLPATVTPGQSLSIPVVVSGGNGLLNAWIDWNQDGAWEANEQIAADLATSTGTYNLDVTIPADAVLGQTYARFRLSTVSGLTPTGFAQNGEVEDYTITVAEPELAATKRDVLFVDADSSGTASPGDTLRYTVIITNSGVGTALNAAYTDTPDANTTLANGSVTTTQGSVTSGNGGSESSVTVAIGDIPTNGVVTIVYDVTINDPLPAGVTQVSNQGIVTTENPNIPDTPTDDPDDSDPDDPTETTIVAAPELKPYKRDALFVDADNSGTPSPGDTLLYTITVINGGNQASPGTVYTDMPDANSTLVVGSVTTDHGTVAIGNNPGDSTVRVEIGTLAGGGAVATITYQVTINNPVPAGVTRIRNQGIVTTEHPGIPDRTTDDPDDPTPDDPTETPIDAKPILQAFKQDTVLVDADSSGSPSPGDTLQYRVTIINSGNADAAGVVYTDNPDPNTVLVNGSVATTLGTISTGNNAGDSQIVVNVGALAGQGGQVIITFDMTINNPLPAGVTTISNQGIVTDDDPSTPDQPTDDPDDPDPDDPTETSIDAQPRINAYKRDTLLIDADNSGTPSPGDTLLYNITIINSGNQAATGLAYADHPDPNTRLVVGSVASSLGTIVSGNNAGDASILIEIETLAGGNAKVEISYHATINSSIGAEVTTVSNQGLVTTDDPNVPDRPTDDPDDPTLDDPTDTSIDANPRINTYKTAILLVDADGNGSPSPGDTLLYNISIINSGNQAASGVEYTDTPDANTTLVAGSVSTNLGSVAQGNSPGDGNVQVNIGALPRGTTVDISYEVTINNPLPGNVTQVSNQGVTTGDNFPDEPSDDPETPGLPKDPTDVVVVAAPVLAAHKHDSVLSDINGNGAPGPGDTLLYNITIINSGNAAATGVVFTDTPDANTQLVPGSVSANLGSIVTGNGANDSTIEIDIGEIPGGSTVEISYQVVIDENLPESVTEIRNQGIVANDNDISPCPEEGSASSTDGADAVHCPQIPTNDPMTAAAGDPTISVIRRDPTAEPPTEQPLPPAEQPMAPAWIFLPQVNH